MKGAPATHVDAIMWVCGPGYEHIIAKIQELFDGGAESFIHLFPQRLQHDVCAVGFEPNPRHAASLRAMEARLRSAGRRVTIIPAAISDRTSEAVFWSDQDYDAGEWGSSLLQWQRAMNALNTSRSAAGL